MTLTVKNGLLVRRRRITGGAEGLIGHVGVVRAWAGEAGNVAMDGALWQARESVASTRRTPSCTPVTRSWSSG